MVKLITNYLKELLPEIPVKVQPVGKTDMFDERENKKQFENYRRR